MEYDFREIERKWREFWAENQVFKVEDNLAKPKYYVLDMFPYPSGAGLHVGHPLGYIASDIYARYKRLKGFNVLHPMGYDSFGLPAEQYAIQTGQHPEQTTRENILRYRDQMDQIGFSFDWSREVRTSNPAYYKWTQWIFTQLFDCYYDEGQQKAVRINQLIAQFNKTGNASVKATHDCNRLFSAQEWNLFTSAEKEAILQQYRLAFLADSWVNWCPALGTVLANDEVINGLSERGGHPVEQKLMRQWSMRIKAYAERLLNGLEKLDWTDSIKDQQRNWIGKSQGCSVIFETEDQQNSIEVFTTRADTIFGVSFLVLAPEHPLVKTLTTAEFSDKVEEYIHTSSLKTERDRQANVKNISGQFIGSYAIHPFTGEKVQLWIGDYVWASYGTGAVMAVPCGDQRDWDFAKHFNIEIKNIFENVDISEGAHTEKEGKIAASDFLTGMNVSDAMSAAIHKIEEKQIGKGKTNFRLRDAVFSRQRYWGEPFPVYYKEGLPHIIDAKYLPIELPEVEKYLPTEDGKPPLGNAQVWAWDTVDNEVVDNINIDNQTVFPLELNTMPGWAGSSWYFLRYMDPHNHAEFVSREKVNYWKNVDLYIGGSEHATGHLLYARFWTKFLYDLDYISFDEPFQKMINQGMILGRSSLIYGLMKPYFKVEKSEDIVDEALNSIDLSNKYEEFIPKEIYVTSEFVNDPTNVYYLNQFNKIKSDLENKIEEQNVSVIFKSDFFYPIHVDVNLVENDELDTEKIKSWRSHFSEALFIKNQNNSFKCDSLVEKMSKSLYNVQTPDELIEKFGADTLRMYEMFLGPLEQSKPWDTKGINGVHNFLRKLWRLFHDQEGNLMILDETPSAESLKTLHKTIQKITQDLEKFSFNTGVSNFMICVNELTEQKCRHRLVLRDLLLLLSPYAPHITEELWEKMGYEPGSINFTKFPEFNPEYLVESAFSYPVSFNGKVRFTVELPADMSKEDIEKHVLGLEQTQKQLDGKEPKKMIVVPGRIVNVVI
jgi:leucyl-tRNA synthetase